MKKTLSILLAFVMMLSISTMAFAANTSTVSLDKDYTVTLKNSSADYTFTAPEDGAYCVSATLSLVKNNIGMASVDVINSEYYSLVSISMYFADSDEGEEPFTFSRTEGKDYFVAKKGSKLTLKVDCDYKDFFPDDIDIEYPALTVTFKVSSIKNVREIKIGESYTISDDEFFIFKPTEDGICDIWSHDCPEFYVMDTDGVFDGGYVESEGYPAETYFAYSAGEIYGVFMNANCDDDGNAVDSVFHVVDAMTIQPDVIDIEDVTVIRGQEESVSPVIYPIGAICNCGDLQIEVGNERIATVEYNPDTMEIIVHGKHLGKTTLTITESNYGVTREIEIEVISRTQNFFRNVFDYISMMFDFIFGR